MVEVDIQFLGGVAITVFLAMLFFGVVVLWDIALALRSVGDKIDKLEDNIDDDLTDIGHSLDNMANAPGGGGGGGTQLHLSGGTISSGPSVNQQGQPGQQGVQSGQQGARSTHPGTEQASPGQQRPDPSQYGGSEASQSPPEDSREERVSAASADAETASETESNEATPDPNESDGSRERGGADESDGQNESGEGVVEHPRAAASRGRFITSPDRTAWYATPLDHDAMANAGPTIAGELEAAGTSNDDSASGDDDDGDGDDDEVVATGPAEVSEEEEPIVAGAAGDDVTIDEDDSPGDERPDGERPDDERDSNDAEDGSEATDENGSEPEEGTDEASRIDAAEGFDFTGGENGDESDADDEVDADEVDAEDVDAEAADEDVAVANDDEGSSDGTDDVLTFDEGDETGLAPRNPGDERDSDDANEVALEPSPNESERGSDDTDAGEERAGERSDGAEEPPTAEDFTDFEFADADADDEEVTVDEAVDTMNDDAPSLSLSSHDFDVTAEYDDGGASLIFEFEPGTIDISGSTKRLLRYQMRSFADQESTPDGEVQIRRNAVVIDIPDADGGAVQRWGEAAVAIIDRTLYLSDNSN